MLMLKILIAEDDPSISQLYAARLKSAGYDTVGVHNGVDACDVIEKEHIDLVITDIMMPVMDGYELVRLLRETNFTLPILMIAEQEDYSSKYKGFSLGIDDYMVKPANPDEMVLRVKALFRRCGIAASRKIEMRHTVLDYDSLTVTCGEKAVTLPQKEFYLLYKLMSYPNKIFTRLQLMDEIWGKGSSSDAQTVDVHINRLRRKFQDNQDFKIVTVRGLGYKAVRNV